MTGLALRPAAQIPLGLQHWILKKGPRLRRDKASPTGFEPSQPIGSAAPASTPDAEIFEEKPKISAETRRLGRARK